MNRKKKFLVVDVETANDTLYPLVYDIGYAVVDKEGNVYEQNSLIIRDVFCFEKELMKTAYYAKKIPTYLEKISTHQSQVVDLLLAKWIIRDVMEKYNIKVVCAYNASFDIRALNTTLRYVTKSKYRWFFPYGTEVHCIWHMACQLLYTQKRFADFALRYDYFSPSGNLQTSAEIGFRYLTNETQFTEEHQGLQDVLIECQIMAKCYAQHKKVDKSINRACWRIPTEHHKEYINRRLLELKENLKI